MTRYGEAKLNVEDRHALTCPLPSRHVRFSLHFDRIDDLFLDSSVSFPFIPLCRPLCLLLLLSAHGPDGFPSLPMHGRGAWSRRTEGWCAPNTDRGSEREGGWVATVSEGKKRRKKRGFGHDWEGSERTWTIPSAIAARAARDTCVEETLHERAAEGL